MYKTWLLGFGFFSIALAWGLYNAFVPLFLHHFIQSATLIGFLMTLDNYIALFLQPYIGNRSDRTNTRFGKRMPYLIIGMPLAAVFISLIPLHTSLFTLIIFMLAMNLSMAIFRSPTVALMPDITPEANRTKANGIINFMGGVGSVIAFLIGSLLFNIHRSVPFITAGIIILISFTIVFSAIKEKRDTITYTKTTKEKIHYREELNVSTIFLLTAIFFWFVAYQGMEAFFTLYGVHELGLSEAQAAFLLTFFAGSFLIFALPSGWLGARFGKKAVIFTGVIGLGLIFLTMHFITSLTAWRVILIIGGMFWAFININSYPFVVSTGSQKAIGTRTGLYYLVSSLAAITSPPLFGQIIDLTDFSILFIVSSISMLLALISLSFVKGEKSKHQSKQTFPS